MTTVNQRRPHLVLWGLSNFGQKAAVFFLATRAARGGALTIVVPRRDQWLFENAKPTVPEWEHFASVKEALGRQGPSVRVLFDDQLAYLARAVVEQRTTNSHLVVGYVTTAADEHLAAATVLVELCERVLVEKPLSNSFDDFEGFTRLAARAKQIGCLLVGAEHYLLRPASLRAMADAGLFDRKITESGQGDPTPADGTPPRWLDNFLTAHAGCALTYEFQFAEAGSVAEALMRPGAFNDGAALDVAVSHGLGALANICVKFGVTPRKLLETRFELRAWCAVDAHGKRVTASVSETAVEVVWRLPQEGKRGPRTVILRSGKLFEKADRYWRLFCTDPVGAAAPARRRCVVRKRASADAATWKQLTGSEKLLYGCGLGADGTTVVDLPTTTAGSTSVQPRGAVMRRNAFGGYRADRQGRGDPEAHSAQSALIEALFSAELSEDDPRVLSIAKAITIGQIALGVQQACLSVPLRPYNVCERVAAVFPTDPVALRKLRAATCCMAPVSMTVLSRFTFRADEGGGRTEVARLIGSQFRGASLQTTVVDVPRHPTRGPDPDADALVAQQVVAQLARAVGVAIQSSANAEEVLGLAAKASWRERAVVVNGVDRVAAAEWPSVARVLALLCPHVGGLAVTSASSGRTVGCAVRLPGGVASTRSAHALDAHGRVIADDIVVRADGNIELARMIGRYLHFASPGAPSGIDVATWRSWLIASLCLPLTLVPATARQRQRVARVIVGKLTAAERREMAVLAQVGGRVQVPVGKGAIEAAYDWVDEGTCAIPSPLRQVLLAGDDAACDRVALDVDTRLSLLVDNHRRVAEGAKPAPGPVDVGPDRARASERTVLADRFLRMPLGEVPFDGPFGDLVLDLVDPIDRKIAAVDPECVAARRCAPSGPWRNSSY